MQQPLDSRFTLGKKERLKSRKRIEQLFKEGKSFSFFPFRVQYMVIPTPGDVPAHPLQAGFSVSTKHFKKAVHRNRIKRLSREAYRIQKNELQHKLAATGKQLALFILFTGREIPDFLLVREKLRLILVKLIQEIDENPPAHT